MTCSISELTTAVIAFRDERDWEQFHNPKDLSMAISIEASELMEHFLWIQSSAADDLVSVQEEAQEIARELADVQIYLLLLADRLGIDLSDAVRKKLQENAMKYPTEKARGISDKYTKL